MSLLLAKRVFAYCTDSFLITLVTLAFTLALRHPLVTAIVNAGAFLVRDVATRAGSPGKLAAGLSLEPRHETFPARLQASVLRNLPIAVPLVLVSPTGDESGLAIIFSAMLLFLVLAVELARLALKEGVRFGDLFAGTRVADRRPQESPWAYAAGTVAVLLLSAATQAAASMFLYPALSH